MHDLLIRGATVLDGLGGAPRKADVAVSAGRVAAIGERLGEAREVIDAGGLALMPGIVDLHTHYDAQVTWDATLSPSPSLGVTTTVMGNCGFGIVPSPPAVRDLILRNLSVVEGMDLDALRAGVDWRFDSFKGFMDAVRARAPYANVAVLVGHSAVRTAVMGADASVRKVPKPEELQRMQALVREAMGQGAIGLGASYSINHSGYGGVPMPSTITETSELEALIAAMAGSGRALTQIASGPRPVELFEEMAARTGSSFFLSTGVAMHNEQEPGRALAWFEQCKAAQARGHQIYVQIPCQALSFDFTLANAYPFFSHPAFHPIKAYKPEQLKPVFRDPSFRASFRENLKNPQPGTIFQGNWERVVIAVSKDVALIDRNVAAIARERGKDPLDAMLDLGLEENLETAFLGRFLNAGNDGVARLLKHPAGVIALSDAGAHLIYMCDAGFGLHFLGHWVRERGDFDLAEGARRLTSHQADLYGIPDRGRIVPGAWADLLLFDPATVGIGAAERVADLPAGGRRTIRRPKGVHGVFVNGVRVFDGKDYVRLARGPGQVLDKFVPAAR
jgi:N-acyl-D-aspartate/D-glutamate deacylase